MDLECFQKSVVVCVFVGIAPFRESTTICIRCQDVDVVTSCVRERALIMTRCGWRWKHANILNTLAAGVKRQMPIRIASPLRRQ